MHIKSSQRQLVRAMAKEITTFPHQIKFKVDIFDHEDEWKSKGEKLVKVVLKDGSSFEPGKAQRQFQCGVELYSSREEIGDSKKITHTVTIESKDALPVEILGFTENSYQCSGRPYEISQARFIIRVFVDDLGKVIEERKER